MGMSAEAYGNCAVIHGPSELKGTDVVALDIRCGAALVLAACAATGITKIHKARNIQRGYENVPNRMKVLGVEVEAVQTGEGEEV